IAEIMEKYDTIGQDLVAMCVNDILCAGAEPFAFLDYMACGRLQVEVAATIVKGIADACLLSGCALLVVDNLKQLPRSSEIKAGDVVLALPSTGVHSNGYSLVQKIMAQGGHRYNEKAPFSKTNKTFGEEFLAPTGIYVRELLPAIKSGLVKALAHITGGGLLENIPRILFPGTRVKLDAMKFKIKPIFGWLQAKGLVSDFEMLRTFNCGIGMVVIADASVVDVLLATVEGIDVVGTVEDMGREGGSTTRLGVLGGLGGFGGCFQLKAVEQEYKDPVLVLAADGVGTKLKVAQKINQHSSIGVDLVAMCVNDILCNGATPLTFLDYFACGSLDVSVARNVVAGVAEGCRQASAALIGGETAEMPGMYEPGVYDIAGFALGVVERANILPKINDINVGDIIIGLPSNGVHSNGFSLIHKLMKKLGLTLGDKAPFSKEGHTLGEELIKPTRIYAQSMAGALRSGRVKAAAHVTGGGLMENIPRVMNLTRSYGAMVIGSVQARPAAGARVIVDNFDSAVDFTRRMPLLPNKKCMCAEVSLVISNKRDAYALRRAEGAGVPTLFDRAVSAALEAHKIDIVCLAGYMRILWYGRMINIHPSLLPRHPGLKAQQQCIESGDKESGCTIHFVDIHPSLLPRHPGLKAQQQCIESGDKESGCTIHFVDIHPSLLPRHPGMKAQQQCIESGDKESGCTIHFVDIHPSLVPRHPGLKAQQQCIESGDKESGCTIHFEGMDTGPIILQEKVPVLTGDTAESLAARILQAEHRAYPHALRLLATGRARALPSQSPLS
ncbi:Phosphoribosylformylglycinamidine cyclo-ligase, partial [Operophtera brumata]